MKITEEERDPIHLTIRVVEVTAVEELKEVN